MKGLYMVDADRGFVQYFENLLFTKAKEYRMLGHNFKANDFFRKLDERKDLLNKIDLLFVNPKLNDLNGLELIKKVQKIKKDINICIIVNENMKTFYEDEIAELGIPHVMIYPNEDSFYLEAIQNIFKKIEKGDFVKSPPAQAKVEQNKFRDTDIFAELKSSSFLDKFDFDSLKEDFFETKEDLKPKEKPVSAVEYIKPEPKREFIKDANYEFNNPVFNRNIEKPQVTKKYEFPDVGDTENNNVFDDNEYFNSEMENKSPTEDYLDLKNFGAKDNDSSYKIYDDSEEFNSNMSSENKNSFKFAEESFKNDLSDYTPKDFGMGLGEEYEDNSEEDVFSPYKSHTEIPQKTNLQDIKREEVDFMNPYTSFDEKPVENNTFMPKSSDRNKNTLSNRHQGFESDTSFENKNNINNNAFGNSNNTSAHLEDNDKPYGEYLKTKDSKDRNTSKENTLNSKKEKADEINPWDFIVEGNNFNNEKGDFVSPVEPNNKTVIENIYNNTGVNDLDYNPNIIDRTNSISGSYERTQNSKYSQIEDFPRQVVAFYSTKGGIGKTTLAVNTVIQLARYTKKKICLVDFDVTNSNVHLHLGIFDTVYDIGSVTNFDSEIDSFSLNKIITKHSIRDKNGEDISFDVIVGLKEMRMSQRFTEKDVHQILSILEEQYDIVIVDTHPVYTDLAVSTILKKANKIIFVTEQDITSLNGAKDFILISSKFGIPAEKLHIVLNRYVSQSPLFTKSKIEKRLNKDILATVPFDITNSRDAINTSLPVSIEKPESELARAFVDVAKIIDKNIEIPEKKGFFGMFKK